MAKIDASSVVKFLFDMQALVDGVYETIRIGDDGFEDSCCSQVKTIKDAINLFVLTNATARTPKEVFPAYVLQEEKLCADPNWDRRPRDYQESITIYKSRLFHYVKRNLSLIKNLDDVKVEHLELRMESDIIFDSVYAKDLQSNEFYYIILQVMADVAKTIVEARKTRPQKKLF